MVNIANNNLNHFSDLPYCWPSGNMLTNGMMV